MGMKTWARRVALLASAGALIWAVTSLAFAQENVTINPALYKALFYRPLTVFARGGRVTAVAGVSSNPQLYYMGTCGGGVWRTTNAGARWEPITDGQINVGSIGAVAV